MCLQKLQMCLHSIAEYSPEIFIPRFLIIITLYYSNYAIYYSGKYLMNDCD